MNIVIESNELDNLMVKLNAAIDHLIVNARRPGRRANEAGELVCYYCGRPLAGKRDIDHVTPICRGGVDKPFNQVVVCQHCNVTKNGRHPVTWLMVQQMDLPDDLALDWLARVLYHYLSAPELEIEPEPVF